MSTTVTVKGQVTLPKAVREAAGIKPGDRVTVRVHPDGGVLIERERADAVLAARVAKIAKAVQDLHAQGIRPRVTADAIMILTRGDV